MQFTYANANEQDDAGHDDRDAAGAAQHGTGLNCDSRSRCPPLCHVQLN